MDNHQDLSKSNKAQISILLNQIQNDLSTVSNDARQSMTLIEYLTRYNPGNVENLRKFTREVLATVVQGSLDKVKRVISEDTVHPAAKSLNENEIERQLLDTATGGHLSDVGEGSDA